MSGTTNVPQESIDESAMTLRKFAPSIYIADGPTVNFYGFPYSTRMAVIKLSNNTSWVWSPIKINDRLAKLVEEKCGPVKYIISPNKLHHLFIREWKSYFPDSKVYASPGLAKRSLAKDIPFHAELNDEADTDWKNDIGQVVVRGSFLMEEVVFFHKESSTVLFCDLIQRHDKNQFNGWKRKLMIWNGLTGKDGSTPKEWRLTFFDRKKARAAREKIMNWGISRLIIAHGECIESGAADVVEKALSWI